MLATVPLEVLHYVFGFCSTSDILNMACCCKQWYKKLIPILWENVKLRFLPWFNDEEYDHNIWENLKYTKKLTIDDKMFCHHTFKEFLKACDEESLHALILDSYCGYPGIVDTILQTVPKIRGISLSHIEMCVDVDSVDRDQWFKIAMFDELEEVGMVNCSFNDAIVVNMVNGDNLTTLHLAYCDRITSISLRAISRATKLTTLSFSRNGNGYADLKLLGNLKNLTCLDLSSSRVGNDVVLHLTKNLLKLKTLDLYDGEFSADGLSEIHNLVALETFDIERWQSPLLTPECFQHIIRLKALKEFSFSSSFTQGQADKVSLLNDMTSLRKVVASGSVSTLAVVVKGLCGGVKEWKLKAKCDSELFNKYTFIV